MTKDRRYFRPKSYKAHRVYQVRKENLRECPSCGLFSLKGMPGGRDAVCKNCGYKDPCCYD